MLRRLSYGWRRMVYICITSALLILVVGVWITRNITRSPLGRALVAIRDSEVSARCMGIDVKHGKSLAMAISAGFTAVAGILIAYAIDGEFRW